MLVHLLPLALPLANILVTDNKNINDRNIKLWSPMWKVSE